MAGDFRTATATYNLNVISFYMCMSPRLGQGGKLFKTLKSFQQEHSDKGTFYLLEP